MYIREIEGISGHDYDTSKSGSVHTTRICCYHLIILVLTNKTTCCVEYRGNSNADYRGNREDVNWVI